MKPIPLFLLIFAALLTLPTLWPPLDLAASGLFYTAEHGFTLANNPILVFLHKLAYTGARVLGIGFAAAALAAWLSQKCRAAALPPKAWLFLLAALLIGPGLVANVGLKDHWGRDRPREITQFGGAGIFTPALTPRFDHARSNGSFVSGDAAFGFFLPAFAYVAPRRNTRRIFWSMMAAGTVFGFVRLAMGAHFLSDILYAAALMLATTAATHAAFYGRKETASLWRLWFTRSPD